MGSVGDYTHIFEYEGYRGFDEFMRKYRADEVSFELVGTVPWTVVLRYIDSKVPRGQGGGKAQMWKMRTSKTRVGLSGVAVKRV